MSKVESKRASGYIDAMKQMRVQRREADVVLGPCPGCDEWQLDYTDEVARQFVILRPSASGGVEADTTEWHAAVEHILQEHMLECPHLRDLYLEATAS